MQCTQCQRSFKVAYVYQIAVQGEVRRHFCSLECRKAALGEEALSQRERLDAAIAEDADTREYLARLEAMASEERIPSGDDLATEIERYLKDQS